MYTYICTYIHIYKDTHSYECMCIYAYVYKHVCAFDNCMQVVCGLMHRCMYIIHICIQTNIHSILTTATLRTNLMDRLYIHICIHTNIHIHSIDDGHVAPGLMHKCYKAKKSGNCFSVCMSVCMYACMHICWAIKSQALCSYM